MVLPFLDQAPLYQQLAPDGGNAPTAPTALTKTVLPFYLGPSDASAAGNQQTGGHAKSNYVGMFGSNKDLSDIGNGMFYFNSSTRTSDLTDGMSNTIATGFSEWKTASPKWSMRHTSPSYTSSPPCIRTS